MVIFHSYVSLPGRVTLGTRIEWGYTPVMTTKRIPDIPATSTYKKHGFSHNINLYHMCLLLNAFQYWFPSVPPLSVNSSIKSPSNPLQIPLNHIKSFKISLTPLKFPCGWVLTFLPQVSAAPALRPCSPWRSPS